MVVLVLSRFFSRLALVGLEDNNVAFVALASSFAGSSEGDSMGDDRSINTESPKICKGLGVEVGEGVKPTECLLVDLADTLFGYTGRLATRFVENGDTYLSSQTYSRATLLIFCVDILALAKYSTHIRRDR